MMSQGNLPESAPKLTTHPYVGIAGVLLGAMIATCTGRLMNVGLADIRGTLHLGVDEASWINTSFNASMMFIGPFSVYLGGLLGPRRELLACAPEPYHGPLMCLTFACLFHVTRLFGGEMGSAFMGHFIAIREQFHSNMLGLNVQLGNGLTDHRLLGLRGAFSTHSTGLTATWRAAEALAMQIRQQAFTLAISDSFIVLATYCAICLVIVALMSRVPTQYHQVIASNARAK
jgi:hypothetical protein